MSQTQELIEQVRAKLNGATDYKLAQVLDLHSEYVHGYVKGTRAADNYACAKIAEILERDPLEVIAQVEAEAARTEKKREYWRSFFSGLKQAPHVVALCGILGFSAAGWPVGAEASSTSHNGRFCSRIGAAGRKVGSWSTKKFGFFSGWSGCFGS